MSPTKNSSVEFVKNTKTSFANSCYVEVIGTGQPMVLLHGWGWHSGIWEHLIPTLSKHFQLFLIDLPGFGHSQFELTTYSIENVAQCILSVTPKRAMYLGWSLGGMIATWIAAHHPERLSHLITLASSPKFMQTNEWPGVPEKTLAHFSKLLLQDFEKTLGDFLELQLRGNSQASLLLEKLKKQLFARENPKLTALLGGLHLLQTLDLREDLTQLHCPSLHIFGQYDTLVPVAIAGRVTQLTQKAQSQIFAKTGHIPFLNETKFISVLLEELAIN